MNNIQVAAIELGVSTTASMGVSSAVNADALLTALITFGVSLVTLAGGELIKFLVAFFKKKTEELEKKDKDDAERKK